MSHSNQDKKHGATEKPMSIGDWVMEHSKIVLPLILVVCVLITVVLAINANKKEALEKESQQAAMAVASEQALPSVDELETPQFELEENAHPEINNLIRTYYDAQAEGDIETISSLNTYLDEIETIRVQELSKYIDSYPVLNVYTKPGLAENTYVTYVYSEVQFSDVDLPLPGMQTYYIGINDEGDYFINDGTYDDTVWNYIKEITLQDDVVDLNNKVVVEYNELLAEDEELNEFIAYLKEKINEDVGEILAQAESAEEETADTAQEEGDTQGAFQMIRTARATDVVNIRTSDSEEADKIDKATRTAVVNAFCQTVAAGGYKPGIYASKTWFEDKLNMGAIGNYKIWLAQYSAAPTYKGRYDMWQYSSKGKISGIKGNVDLNYSYLGY